MPPLQVPPVQVRPHAPQFVAVLVLVSQPLPMLLSQSAKPVLQAIPHTPLVQPGRPLAKVPLQTTPQPPQFAGSVARSRQAIARVQNSPRTPGHWQRPATQTSVARQAAPQAPQLAVLVARSTQAPPQVAEVGSVAPSQLSSMPLQAISVLDVSVHAQVGEAPMPARHDQFEPVGQSSMLRHPVVHREKVSHRPTATLIIRNKLSRSAYTHPDAQVGGLTGLMVLESTVAPAPLSSRTQQ